MFFEEELKFPRFYSIAIMILWSEFSNQLCSLNLQEIRKLKASSGAVRHLTPGHLTPDIWLQDIWLRTIDSRTIDSGHNYQLILESIVGSQMSGVNCLESIVRRKILFYSKIKIKMYFNLQTFKFKMCTIWNFWKFQSAAVSVFSPKIIH